MKKIWLFILLVALTSNQQPVTSNGICGIAANASFEEGDNMPQDWVLSGFTGAWEDSGKDGRKCISVTGDGENSNFWKSGEAGLEPGKIYRVSFWAKSEGTGGGCAVSGPNLANRDYNPGPEWALYGFVFKVPDNGGAFLRFGQWCVNGKVLFDNITLNEARPVNSLKAGMELGEGEKMQDNEYVFSSNFDWEGSNYCRPLIRHNTAFNSNRWCLARGTYVVYRHNAGSIAQKNAAVKVTIGYYQSGECLVEASADNENFEEIGRIGKPGTASFTVPETFFPAKEIFVKLSGAGSGCNLQVNAYGYEAGLAGANPDLTGSTRFAELFASDSDLDIIVLSFGSPEEGRSEAGFTATNNSGREIKAIAKLEIAGKEFTRNLKIKSGETLTSAVPYDVEFSGPGEFPVKLTLVEENPGKVLHCAGSVVRISSLNLSNYGYSLPDSGVFNLWWCEGAYKVNRGRKAPAAKAAGISVSAAGNEYEPFQLVLRPGKDLETVTVEISDLVNKDGNRMPKESVTIDVVGYVNIQIPSDNTGSPGMWPDPLPRYKKGFRAEAGKNQPVWFTVFVPENAAPGNYAGKITLRAGKDKAAVPLTLCVRDFTLPETTHLRSGFGFDPDTVRRYHNLRSSAETAEVNDMYYRNFAQHRICPYSPMRQPSARFTRDTETRKVTGVEVNFTKFDEDCAKYLDGMGFNAFSLRIEGMGSGTFFNRQAGTFGGYRQGTAEYDGLWGRYMKIIQDHLEEKGWLKKAYIYWFDEPEPKDFEFVNEGMKSIKKAAPKIARMLTKEPRQELSGFVDLWCPILHCYDEEKARERQKQGEEVWWYVCTGPKAPYLGLFIDHPAVDLRVWSWMSWQFGIQGLLIWDTTWWTSPSAYPKKPQNPWFDPMSYVSGYGFQAGQVGYWGNGDGRFFYPPNRDAQNDKSKYLEGPVNSIRWELLREGIEDYEYFWVLRDKIDKLKKAGADRKVWGEAEKLLDIPKEIFTGPANYSKDPQFLYSHRQKVAEAIEFLSK